MKLQQIQDRAGLAVLALVICSGVLKPQQPDKDRDAEVVRLVKILQSEDVKTATGAVDALARLRDRAMTVFPVLVQALRDKRPQVVGRAVVALESMADLDVPVVQALIPVLRDPRSDVVVAALSAMGRIGKPPEIILPSLMRALDDERSSVVAGAVTALVRMGEHGLKAEHKIKKLASSKHEDVVAAVRTYLELLEWLRGTILISDYSDNRVVGVNRAGTLFHVLPTQDFGCPDQRARP